MSTHWDPGQYARFSSHRLRPALELLARIPVESPRMVVDLGCGTGNVTRILADRWPEAKVVGVDNSPQMLAEARAGSEPGSSHSVAPSSNPIRWVEADIATWKPEASPGGSTLSGGILRPDVLYSNAALHWLGGHETLFPRLAGLLGAGGCLAVQMPLSWDASSHRLMREALASGGPGGRPLGPATLRRSLARRPVESAETYYDLLTAGGLAVDIWETEYLQILNGEDPVLNWIKGTGLRPVLATLSDNELEMFLATYRQTLRSAYPPRSDGTTLYPFRRLFIVVAA